MCQFLKVKECSGPKINHVEFEPVKEPIATNQSMLLLVRKRANGVIQSQ